MIQTAPNVKVIPAVINPLESTNKYNQLRVAAYCRVSTDQEEQQNSYNVQIMYYTDLINRKKEWTLAGIFADEGISGTQAKKRPEFLKMIRMCKKQKIDLVITKSISRFARNTVDCLEYVRQLKGLGIGVIFEKENINTLTMTSEFMIALHGSFAQAESESISKNVSWGKQKAFAEGNMLQVLVFAVVVGFTLIAVGEKGQPLLNVIDSLNEVCLKVISTVMYFTPIGVFCTIVPVVEANGTKTIVSLATQLIILYVAFYGFAIVVYGGAVKLIGKTSPVKFFKAIMPAALNAFGTCSSSATIPISKRCVEKELGVSNQISSIAIPLGATVNMDAVSILMSFMIMFFANACGINVSISMMVIILLANVLLSVGTPGIPGGAIASFAALATMAGLPAGVMGVYISINTLCDMGATCVNVIGDMAGCVVLQEKIKLEEN